MKQIGVCVNLQSKYSLDLTQFEKAGGKGIKKNRQIMNRIILIGNGFDLAKINENQFHRRSRKFNTDFNYFCTPTHPQYPI